MLRVLGPVEIDGHGTLRSRAQRVLLGALALDAGHVVSGDRLAELIWGDDQPEHPEASLQSHVSRLRKVLPAELSIESVGDGYRVVAPPHDLDVSIFETGFRRACEQQPEDRSIDELLALWHGPPFADLDDDRARAEAARLDEMLLALRELRAESLIVKQRTHEAIADLEVQRREAPLRERTVELLMRAHLEAGRKSDALAVYRELRTILIDELGLDPSPELRELERAILTEDIVASHRPADTAPRLPASSVQLPPSSLFGRQLDLERVTDEVRKHRIVTLVGPGGVGKTRLALHSAAELVLGFDEGITFIELASIRDPGELSNAIASELGLLPRSGISAEDRIVDALTGRHHLLVLDNCEHLIDAAAAFVERVVVRSRALHFLCTSREPLNIDGERVLRIRPLPTDGSAIELFADRAAAHSDLTLDHTTRPQIEQICTALDGIPLAIELAAARCAAMTLEEIIEGLEQRLVLFDGGRRTAHERHRSLRALVEWSARALDPDLETVFVRTSVFAGAFAVEAAANVTGSTASAVRLALAELIDRSLLVEHIVPGRATRYRFLETIRAYAAEQLAESPDSAEVVDRHSSWILELIGRMSTLIATDRDVEAMDDVIASLGDVRIVHARLLADDDADRSLQLASSLHHLAMFRMHAELFRWIRQTADRFGESEHPLAEDVVASASVGLWQSGDLDGARRYAERAAIVATRSRFDGAGRGSHEALGDVLQFGGDDRAAIEHFDAAIRMARAQNDDLRLITNLADLAMVLSYEKDIERVGEIISEADRLATETGSATLGAWVAYAQGEALADIDPDRASVALARALELAERSSANFIIGVAGLTRTGILARGGEPTAAIPGIIELIEHWRRGGAWVQLWITLRTVAELLVRLDRSREAALVLGALLAADDSGEASGPDAGRLADVKRDIEARRSDAEQLLAAGATMGQGEVTDIAVESLTQLSGQT